MAERLERLGLEAWCPGLADPVGLAEALVATTATLRVGTAIQSIQARRAEELAGTAALVQELAEGRFTLGLGVSHLPSHNESGVRATPLEDMRSYVDALHAAASSVGPLPRIALAALQPKMARLATEIGDGVIFANVSRKSISRLIPALRENANDGFEVGTMVPTVVHSDQEVAAGRARSALEIYLRLANYRNYWRYAGYWAEMDQVEASLGGGVSEGLSRFVSPRMLDDLTVYGDHKKVAEGLSSWYDAGVDLVIVAPYSVSGGPLDATLEALEVVGHL